MLKSWLRRQLKFRIGLDVNFSLEEGDIIRGGVEAKSVLRHGGSRFNQPIGSRLDSIRPDGPMVVKHGTTLQGQEGDGAEGRI